MWITDDTTWNLTAQRHKLSSDVMHLSSVGESQSGEKNTTGLIVINTSRLKTVTEDLDL